MVRGNNNMEFIELLELLKSSFENGDEIKIIITNEKNTNKYFIDGKTKEFESISYSTNQFYVLT